MQSASSRSSVSVTARVARWSANHRWWVFAASLLVLVAAVVASVTYSPQLQDGDGNVGESKVGLDVLDKQFPQDADSPEQLLFNHPSLNVDDRAYQETVEVLVAELRELPQVVSVSSYYETNDPSMVSEDRHVLRAAVLIDSEIEVDGHRADAVLDAVKEARQAAQDDGYPSPSWATRPPGER